MLTLEVQVNGELVAVAGSPQLNVLAATVTAVGKLGPDSAGTTRNPEDEGIDLRVGGMTAPLNGQAQDHVDWVVRDLVAGDEVIIRIAEAGEADEPRHRQPAGSLESQEQAMFEYARDVAFSGQPKGLILMGRVVSEEPGMARCAAWLETVVPEVPVRHISAGDPYWRPAR